MDNQDTVFQYTYSAKEQSEVESIRKKYLPPEEDKLAKLRKLDHGVTKKAQGWALTLGIFGALILGTGMSLAMTDFGKMPDQTAMVLGIVIGLIGLGLVALAYPVYNRILKKERQRIAPEILRLTDELMK